MKLNRVFGILLALCLLLTSLTTVAVADEDNRLRIAVKLSTTSTGTDKVWFWKWARDHFDIDFDIIEVPQASMADWKTLAFASNDLPDVIISMYFTSDELVSYGALEGQLVDLSKYVTDSAIMPNLAGLYAAHPEYKAAVSTADGSIYGLGKIGFSNRFLTFFTYFVKQEYLDRIGYDSIPDTMEGIVDMLREFKKLDGVIPCEGFNKSVNISNLIFASAGLATSGNTGFNPALKYTDGQEAEVVLSYADRDVYTYYLTTMNTLFTEGLITDDYYTQTNSNQIKANVAEGKSAMICHNLSVYGISDYDAYTGWKAVAPLTSAINNHRIWPEVENNLTTGGVVVTSHCKNVELACSFIDWFYDANNLFTAEYGFPHGDEQNYEYGGYMIDDNGVLSHYDYTVNHMDESESMYVYTYKQGWDNGVFGYQPADYTRLAYTTLDKEALFKPDDNFNDSTANGYVNMLYDAILAEPGVGVKQYPNIIFFTPEETEAVMNLKSIIEDYVSSESANFITGVRPLNEIDNFFDELDVLGVQELLGYYKNYYENIQH